MDDLRTLHEKIADLDKAVSALNEEIKDLKAQIQELADYKVWKR